MWKFIFLVCCLSQILVLTHQAPNFGPNKGKLDPPPRKGVLKFTKTKSGKRVQFIEEDIKLHDPDKFFTERRRSFEIPRQQLNPQSRGFGYPEESSSMDGSCSSGDETVGDPTQRNFEKGGPVKKNYNKSYSDSQLAEFLKGRSNGQQRLRVPEKKNERRGAPWRQNYQTQNIHYSDKELADYRKKRIEDIRRRG